MNELFSSQTAQLQDETVKDCENGYQRLTTVALKWFLMSYTT